MSLRQVLAVAALWAVGQADVELKQPQVSITSQVGSTAQIICQVTGMWYFPDWYIHWYQKKPNQPLQHLISVQSTSKPQKIPSDNVSNKFVAEKNEDKSTTYLTINSITPEDEGTYYCACWKYHSHQLSITNHTRILPPQSPPTSSSQAATSSFLAPIPSLPAALPACLLKAMSPVLIPYLSCSKSPRSQTPSATTIINHISTDP